MNPIDQPVSLSYNHGSFFPSVIVFLGYLLMPVSVFSILMGAILLGPVLAVFSALLAFSYSSTTIAPEKGVLIDVDYFLGFIPYRKSTKYEGWKYLTVLPERISSTVYSRANNSTTLTEYYFTISMLNSSYRNKRPLIRFKLKNEAEEVAKKLSDRIQMSYFEYSPEAIRNALRK